MMKKLFISCMIMLSFVVLFSCGSKQTNSKDSSSDDIESTGLSGVFIKGSDTLKISKDPDSFMNEIEFDLYAKNSMKQQFVFDTAPFSAGTDDTETYDFRDSSEYAYTDLKFTFSYKDDSWIITDKVYTNDPDSTRRVDLSGEYKRLK